VRDSTKAAITTLRALRERYPTTPFLALGQTVWWDEPMKAVLRALLDEGDLGGEMLLGVHDTDYFAKVNTRLPGQSRFDLLPHNDGTTRDLWSAAGEISRLFGSECLPARHDLTGYGIPLRQLAQQHGDARQEFINQNTAAWGWRGLVYTGSRDLIVHELKLDDVMPGIRAMLEYGFDGTLASIESPSVARAARRHAKRLIADCCDYCRTAPDATLPDLYRHMYPRLFGLLLGRPMSDYSVTSTSELLRFGPDTADKPRFALVDRFLRPDTRPLAVEAYDEAVGGSEMYTLSKFGLGALPFDIVIPGHGRGTLRVTLRAVHVECRDPIRIRTARPVTSVRDLAAALSERFGPATVLVGKAVTLITMLASEFIFVFNEEGSAYVSRTRAMNDRLAAAGLDLQLHPILRVHYQTWDAAGNVRTMVSVPDPMSGPFRSAALSLAELSKRWRHVVAEQEALLSELAVIRSPRKLLAYLVRRSPGEWTDAARRYSRLTQEIVKARHELGRLDTEAAAMRDSLTTVRRRLLASEAARGNHFRSVARWTDEEEARREEYGAAIQAALTKMRALLKRMAALRRRRLAMGRGEPLNALRHERKMIEQEAQRARLELVRNAILTTRGLTHADHRPSAWWLPVVDPSGGWFRAVVETARLYVQPLRTDDC